MRSWRRSTLNALALAITIQSGGCKRDEAPPPPVSKPVAPAPPLARALAAASTPYVLKLPLGLFDQGLVIPKDNALTRDKIELGRLLYFDKRLSADGTVACASCHDPKFAFTDGQPVSTGIRGQKGGRSAPTVINRVFSSTQFWDGRAASLEEQAKGPLTNPIEMGNANHDEVVARLRKIAGYRTGFAKVFGTETFTIDHLAQAIAAFERTVVSGNSPYDRFDTGTDPKALSESAQRGMALFRGKALCTTCHGGFNFSDELYHNLGVGMDKPKPDFGRYEQSKVDKDRGAFRTPTLRDIAKTGPYMHDGRFQTLGEVIDFYDRGGLKNKWRDPKVQTLKLNHEEKIDLNAFLDSLNGDTWQTIQPPTNFPE